MTIAFACMMYASLVSRLSERRNRVQGRASSLLLLLLLLALLARVKWN